MKYLTPRRVTLAAGTAAMALSATLLAPAAHADVFTTVDAHSNIRTGPYTSSHIVGTTRALSDIDIICYKRGTDVNSGGYHTDVWYKGIITDGDHVYSDFYTWGGNVNTSHDPASGVPHC
jgi:uncharacterized protein YraI